MKKHLTTDELVDKLYGVGADGHLNECEECSERFGQLRERREMVTQPLEASYEFLAAQRRDIYARMGEKPQARMKWVPALAAAACLVAAGVFVHHPAAQVAKPEVVDPQLFADVYSMEQSMEPLAAKPIHALFDQDQQ
jgi:predicted anti-sigma-YlaC factor YlaD